MRNFKSNKTKKINTLKTLKPDNSSVEFRVYQEFSYAAKNLRKITAAFFSAIGSLCVVIFSKPSTQNLVALSVYSFLEKLFNFLFDIKLNIVLFVSLFLVLLTLGCSRIEKEYKDRCRKLQSNQENTVPTVEGETNNQHIYESVPKLNIPSYKIVNRVPEKQDVLLTHQFFGCLPGFINRYAKMLKVLDRHFIQFISAYSGLPKEDCVYGFIYHYFTTIAVTMFGNNVDDDDVRVHMRILKDGNYYGISLVNENIFVSDTNNEAYKKTNERLTVIPKEERNMIYYAYEFRKSLVKSLNRDFHFETRNDDVWKDYLTIPVLDIFLSNNVVFGISIKYPDMHSEALKFLSYMRIETHISAKLKAFQNCDPDIDLLEILNAFVGGHK